MDNNWFFWFSGCLILEFVLQGGLMQTKLVAKVIVWQFKCSHTSRLKVWPEYYNDFFGIWNVSYGCHWRILSTRFLLCSTLVLAALPHLQKGMDLSLTVQFWFLRLFLQFEVIFCFCSIRCCTITNQYSGISSSKQPNYDIFPQHLASSFGLSPANNISPKGKSGLHSDTMWYNRQYVASHVAEIGKLCVSSFFLASAVSTSVSNGFW